MGIEVELSDWKTQITELSQNSFSDMHVWYSIEEKVIFRNRTNNKACTKKTRLKFWAKYEHVLVALNPCMSTMRICKKNISICKTQIDWNSIHLNKTFSRLKKNYHC